MSPEQQRIAIAEACGWKTELWAAGGWCCYSPSGDRQGFAGTSEASYCLHAPDYLNDLNAMHEAEKVMNEDQNIKYRDALCSVVAAATPVGQRWFYWWNAKAAQRAEAFLRTLGLWSTPAAKE